MPVQHTVIPRPLRVEPSAGDPFTLTAATRITVEPGSPEAARIGEQLAALLLPTVRPAPAPAQEVGVFASAAGSDQPDLRGSGGLGAHVTLSPFGALPFLALRLGYGELSRERDREGTVCDTYWPEFRDCAAERVRSEARLRTWSVGGRVAAPLGRRVRVELGGAVTRSRVSLDARGESGRGTGVHVPEERQPGIALHGGLVLERAFGTPLGAALEASRQQVDFTGCVTDVGTPFCGSHRLVELRAGLRYRF